MARTGERIREYEVGPPPSEVDPGPREKEREIAPPKRRKRKKRVPA